MNKENLFLEIINKTISDNSYLGDDCAYIKELNLLLSQDSLIEGVHFSLSYFEPYELGMKSLLVNISDILAGGGVPKYYSVSLSGKLDEKFIEEFYRGLEDISKTYNLKLIGGDLTKGDKITVSISILGDTKGRNISSRKNAKYKDLVYLKGYHGSSAMGLKMLNEKNYDKNNEFIKAHIKPVLYPEIAYGISKKAKNYVMMDTSDGLYDALYKVSKASNIGFIIDTNKVQKKVEDKNLVLYGGEDYGLLICLNPKYKKLAQELNLIQIGEVTKEKIVIDGVEVSEDKSYQHF